MLMLKPTPMMPLSAAEIARHLDGEVRGDPAFVFTGFAPAGSARPGDLTFAENQTYFDRAERSAAAGIMVDGAFKSEKKIVIQVKNARIAFAKILPLFFPEPAIPPGIHPTAAVDPSASIHPSAHVGARCVIGAATLVGPRVVLHPGVVVGDHCEIGEESHIYPNVTLYTRTQIGKRNRIHAGTVIGSDGFGYVLDGGVHRKVPQTGNVVIQDDVEIGANVAIDRGALGSTTIGRGSKIDNLVQIAHNVAIGEHSLVIAQTGIAGSTKLGNYVILAGQVGIAGHLKIGNKVTVAAQSGVMNDVPDGEKWFGYPAQPDRQMKRQLIALQQLPDLAKRVIDLERYLGRGKRAPDPSAGASGPPPLSPPSA